MLKKIINPLVLSMLVLLPIMTACSSDSSKAETTAEKAAPVKEVTGTSSAKAYDFKIEPKKVADGVWCMFGALEMPTADNRGYMSNSCYIKTEDSWVVWDTGATYNFAKQVYAAMSKIADLPVKTIIFSHEHDDHWLGAGFYKEKFNSKLIGPKLINERYTPGQEARTRMFNILNPEDVTGTKIMRMDESYANGKVFKFGTTTMEYIALGQAHSEEDFLLYLPEKKLILTADVVMNGRVTSNRNGLVMGQLAALDLIKSKDWDVLVPGHGFITDKTAADESIQYFTLMKDRIIKALDDGVEATEINQVVTLPEFKDKALYDVLNSNNVSRSYGEFEML